VAKSIASSVTSRLSAVRLSVRAALVGGASPADVTTIVQQALASDPPEVAAQRPTGGRQLKGVAYYGPAMAMFFVLFAIGFTARGFFLERRDGTLDRMVAAPVRPSAVLAGKALSVFVYALASLLTMSFLVGAVFDASWGSPLGVIALCVGMATAVVALAALVMSVAHTERQAETLASAITFSLALFGGNFVFVGAAPALLRRIAGFTPNGLALRAFTDLGTGAGASAVMRPLAGIAVFTVSVGALAAVAGRRAVVQ
jgi:ABC-2 type transport system permease protein